MRSCPETDIDPKRSELAKLVDRVGVVAEYGHLSSSQQKQRCLID